jgi:hypothetical protein
LHQILIPPSHLALLGKLLARQARKAGGFASAIGADECNTFTGHDLEAHAL